MVYYDLNIPWPVPLPSSNLSTPANDGGASTSNKKGKNKVPAQQSQTHQQSLSQIASLPTSLLESLRLTLSTLIHLSYSVSALNVMIPPHTKFDLSTLRYVHPFASTKSISKGSKVVEGKGKPPWPELDPRWGWGDDGGGDGVVEEGKMTQLSRITIQLDEGCVGAKGAGSFFTTSNSQYLQSFDVVAVQPLDNASFAYVLQNLCPSSPGPFTPDILSLDLSHQSRLPFNIHSKRSAINQAIKLGLQIEIVYAPAMRSVPEDGQTEVNAFARRNLIAGAREVVRVCNGKGIILSSGALRAMELRGPEDIANLGVLLGMKPEQAKDSLSANPRAAILRGQSNRQTHRTVISEPRIFIQTTTTTTTSTAPATGKTTAASTVSAATAPSTQDTQVRHTASAQKRKRHGAGDDTQGDGDDGQVEQDGLPLASSLPTTTAPPQQNGEKRKEAPTVQKKEVVGAAGEDGDGRAEGKSSRKRRKT